MEQNHSVNARATAPSANVPTPNVDAPPPWGKGRRTGRQCASRAQTRKRKAEHFLLFLTYSAVSNMPLQVGDYH